MLDKGGVWGFSNWGMPLQSSKAAKVSFGSCFYLIITCEFGFLELCKMLKFNVPIRLIWEKSCRYLPAQKMFITTFRVQINYLRTYPVTR